MIGFVWYGIIRLYQKCTRETWWIVTWILHKKRNPDAKRSLMFAIRSDNKENLSV